MVSWIGKTQLNIQIFVFFIEKSHDLAIPLGSLFQPLEQEQNQITCL